MIFLMAICLTVITQIIYDYSQILKQSQDKENELFGIQMGLHKIAGELREANEVLIPENIGDTENVVELKRRDQPYLPDDYESDSSEPDYGFNMKDPQNEEPSQVISYSVVSGKLCRNIRDSEDRTISSNVLVENVNCLNAAKKSDGEYEVSITIKEKNSYFTIKTIVQVRSKI